MSDDRWDQNDSIWGLPIFTSEHAPGVALVRWDEEDGEYTLYRVTPEHIAAWKREALTEEGKGGENR
jgi:hypothetical protein